ncbi:TPA: hypothetical protein HA278_03245 [Candidatus Woesearchaeota archaeon]|nr:hypothetical protein [archaeon]HIJ11049.1 hypothetical protein [Candidatus Woesearchaeota archaeon]
MKKEVSIGTIRLKKNGIAYRKARFGWIKAKQQFPHAKKVITLFKASKNIHVLVDPNNKSFLKGSYYQGQPRGARIQYLPNGDILEKAYSLFAPHLTIHDQTSHDHWDVLYQNKGGTYSYVYTKAKRTAHRNAKYKKVELFNKHYKILTRNVHNALGKDAIALPLHTLLKTYMRIGNETYYNAHNHKGLTTLQRKDVSIKGNQVTFNYIGKDGVPLEITTTFCKPYITVLQKLLTTKKKNEFIFTTNSGRPLPEPLFKHAFIHYCGHEFYPHIVRSHYATSTVKQFLKGKRTLTKKEAVVLYTQIAHKLGHKKFNKKTQQWDDSFTVTVHSYIQPQLIEKINNMI